MKEVQLERKRDTHKVNICVCVCRERERVKKPDSVREY